MSYDKRLIHGIDFAKLPKNETKYKYIVLNQKQTKTSIYPAADIIHKYYELHEDGTLIVKVGYHWNGADIIPDTICVLRGSVFS